MSSPRWRNLATGVCHNAIGTCDRLSLDGTPWSLPRRMKDLTVPDADSNLTGRGRKRSVRINHDGYDPNEDCEPLRPVGSQVAARKPWPNGSPLKTPILVTARMTKSLRLGKLFIDWSQNNPAKTTIAPYSLRGREHPTVSTPVTWDEVRECRHAEQLVFTADGVLDRVQEFGDLFATLSENRAALPLR